MCPNAEKILPEFEFLDEPRQICDAVIQKFSVYFVPKVNLVDARSLLNQRVQRTEENTEAYVRALYELAERTKFHDKDEAIRDRLVLGVMGKELSEKLQLTSYLTLKKATERARQSDQVNSKPAAQRHGRRGHDDAVGKQTVHPRDGPGLRRNRCGSLQTSQRRW